MIASSLGLGGSGDGAVGITDVTRCPIGVPSVVWKAGASILTAIIDRWRHFLQQRIVILEEEVRTPAEFPHDLVVVLKYVVRCVPGEGGAPWAWQTYCSAEVRERSIVREDATHEASMKRCKQIVACCVMPMGWDRDLSLGGIGKWRRVCCRATGPREDLQ